ncbi:MAG: DUF4410 domain-containing protein [Acidobacteria bacterium]|nr:DUF4410 domain-containing protein [Acidobacteriota bacterium]
MILLLLCIAFGESEVPYFDEGRLEFDYFSDQLLEFRKTSQIDFLWVKPGFDLSTASLKYEAWPTATFIGEDADGRDEDDQNLAITIGTLTPQTLRSELLHRIKFSPERDVVVRGRVCDASTGSEGGKYFVGFGVGQGSVAVDLKFCDAQTGELLVAIHHRIVSGSNFSTSSSKYNGWLKKMVKSVASKGFDALYSAGTKPKQDKRPKDSEAEHVDRQKEDEDTF